MSTAKIVGANEFTYEMDEDWAALPAGWNMPAAAVAGDSQDRIYCFNRDPDHPIVVFDRMGAYLSSWGAGLIDFAHAILVDRADNVWLVDRNQHQVLKFTPSGELLMTIGVQGFRSETGVAPDDYSSTAYQSVTRGAGPFNMPAGVALNQDGEVFVADGYANARVHKFSAEGEYLMSWGEPGNGPGEFNLPHGLCIDRQGRVLVADRENDRVQVFSQRGDHIATWPTPLVGPALPHVDDDDIVYVPEHNGGLVSVLDLNGNRLAQWGSMDHYSCHGVWADSRKDLYVVMPGEWGRTRRVVKFHRRS